MRHALTDAEWRRIAPILPKYEMRLNLKTAKALGLSVLFSLLVRADDILE